MKSQTFDSTFFYFISWQICDNAVMSSETKGHICVKQEEKSCLICFSFILTAV